MFRRKCPSCAKKIDKNFNYCPFCGESFKKVQEEKDYGLLGKEDSDIFRNEVKLPFGMNKVLDSLMKQLEKQMSEMNQNQPNGFPKGFKIKISTGNPQFKQIVEEKKPKTNIIDESIRERLNLPKVEASSKVKRLGDKLIYEIETPGVRSPKEVIVTQLESGIEVKAYSKEKCFTKIIPMNIELINYYIKNDKLFLELKV
jgi:hypothetical protein